MGSKIKSSKDFHFDKTKETQNLKTAPSPKLSETTFFNRQVKRANLHKPGCLKNEIANFDNLINKMQIVRIRTKR